MPRWYSAEPRPKPFAPATRYAAMLSGVIPPTGSNHTSAGSTARHALTIVGGSASAGNILSASAPAASAPNASVGVATPGTHSRPCALAARITA